MTDPLAPPANGPVAAAVLSCGIGCFLLGVLDVAADGSKAVAGALNFYKPTGPLSGVTTVALVGWVICWALLGLSWKNQAVSFKKVAAASFFLLALGLLLTFPPVGDLLLGR